MNPSKATTAAPGALSMSVAQFCRANSISVALYYKLRAAGLAPREMKLGSRTLISIEAAADWRRARESATAAATAADAERRVGA